MDLEVHTESQSKALKPRMYSAGIGAGIAAAILTLNPVKQFFWTREEGVASQQRIEKVEERQDETQRVLVVLNDKIAEQNGKLREEILSQLNRNTDKILESLKERDVLTQKRLERLENLDRLSLQRRK